MLFGPHEKYLFIPNKSFNAELWNNDKPDHIPAILDCSDN